MRFRLPLLLPTDRTRAHRGSLAVPGAGELEDAGRLAGRPDPSLAPRPRQEFRPGAAGACRDRPHDRLLVSHRGEEAGERRQPVRRAYRFSDLDEFVRNAGLHGMEVMLTIWGTPKWANMGGARTTRRPNSQTCGSSPRRSQTGTPAGIGDIPSCASTRSGTSRTSGCSSPRSTTRGDKPVAPKIYAGSTARRTPGSRPGTGCPRRHRRDVRPRPRPLPRAERHAGDGVAGQASQGSSPSKASAEVRRLVAPPVLDDPEAEADRSACAGRT